MCVTTSYSRMSPDGTDADPMQYIGEEGATCLFKAAVVCSNPWDMDVSNKFLQSTWLGLHVYQRAMGASLKGLFDR